MGLKRHIEAHPFLYRDYAREKYYSHSERDPKNAIAVLGEMQRLDRQREMKQSTFLDLISDIEPYWHKISKGEMSREEIAQHLKSGYRVGTLPNQLKSKVSSLTVYIDKSSLSHTLSKHGTQYSFEEFKMMSELVEKPQMVLDNSSRLDGSALLYAKIPNKDKVLLEAVVKPDDDMLLIHFVKVGIRKQRSAAKKYKILYNSDGF